MPGVRINHLLASTAVVLLLAGAPAVTLAGPNDTGANAAAAAPTPADADKTPAVVATPQRLRRLQNPQRPPAHLRRLHLPRRRLPPL